MSKSLSRKDAVIGLDGLDAVYRGPLEIPAGHIRGWIHGFYPEEQAECPGVETG
ncbi:MAG: hypothetical protein AB1426_05665 [Bacillota bacterium]